MKHQTFRTAILNAVICVVLLVPSAKAQFLWSGRIASITNWPEGEPNTGLALDTNDNCYVTGYFDGANNFGGVILTNQSAGGSDIFVAKYNATGALQWVQRAGGTSVNYGRGISADTNGNIYVTGGYQGPAAFGTTNLTATSGEQFFLAKYNSAGTVQWVQSSTGGSTDNYGIGLAVDNAGNSYALAVMDHSGTSITFGTKTVTTVKGGTTLTILVKYDNTGTAQWAQLLDSSQETYATKLAVDAAGNVYVRGLFQSDMTIGTSNLTVSAGSTKNAFIAKFNSSGTLTWIQQPQGGNAGEGGVAVDPAGNVFISGYFNTNLIFGGSITLMNAANSSAPFGDAFLAKYNSSGVIQWAQAAGDTNGGFYWDLALDTQTNIYAAGILGYEAAVAKYSADGTLQWTYSASGAAASPVSSGVAKCAVDAAGHCYLNGFYQGTATIGTNTLQPQEAWNFFLTEVAPYSFGPEVQTTSTANITYNSSNGAFQYTNAANSSSDTAYLPLIGSITNLITTTNDWTVSINANLAATSLTATINSPWPHVQMGLGVLSSSTNVLLQFGQINNTGGGDNEVYPDGFYGTVASFTAHENGGSQIITPLGNSQSVSGGGCYLQLSGVNGPADSYATESINALDGVLSLNYNASTETLMGLYNGIPVGSYSLASWAYHQPITIVVGGGSENIGVSVGMDTASNFLVSASATIQTPTIQFTATPTNGASPLMVQFNSPIVDSLGNAITSWNWNFGDGGTSSLQNPSNTYTASGIFTPTLVATNVDGVTVIGYGPQITAFAFSGNFTYLTNNGAVTIIGYAGPGGALTIPDTINALPVTGIGAGAFEGASLTSVTIPSSVTNIGDYAFEDCASLTSAYFLGNAPSDDGTVFSGDSTTVYYLPGTTGWGATFGGVAAMALETEAGVVFTSLHSFGIYTNGAYPSGTLVQGSDGNFYGTTSGGGTNGGYGTVFEVATNGALTLLHTFTGGNDGTSPYAGLVQGSEGNFYGTARFGGAYGSGTVFKISASGTFTSLHSFTGGNGGADPIGGLVQASDGDFYGTTDVGGTNNQGCVFRISTNGAFTSMYSFTGSNDGTGLVAGLVQGNDGNFYGTTEYGGTGVGYHGHGTVFKISTNGAFTSLYSFTNGNDGGNPEAGLVRGSDGNFYGTTYGGGTNNQGTIFKISTSGVFASLYSFTYYGGASPVAGLVQGSDGNFYGTTRNGGTSGEGTVFKISASGAFTNLYFFTGSNDGGYPQAGLVQGNDGNFYGTAENGGTIAGYNGLGTLFKISASGAFTSLYSFPGLNDGGDPEAGLIQGNDGNFYGTTSQGGTNGAGTAFKIGADGTLATLYSFTGGNDGGYPDAGLVQGSDGNFYGTTSSGGTNGGGTVFKISASGVLTPLYSFTGGNDGGQPYAGLVQGSDGNFYGTTEYGGTNGNGTVFKISAAGAFVSLYSFTGGNDGAFSQAGLVQGSDGNFYGTTEYGGTNGGGTVFKITIAGMLTSLYSFTGGNDGWDPQAGLAQGSDGNFYGTTEYGGTNGGGTVFKITIAGMLTSLYSFTGGNDGWDPQAGLAQGSDGNFYGTTSSGGTNGGGTVFKITIAGMLTSLYSFTGGDAGENPQAGLVQGFDGNFYGTTYAGGIGGNGTVFSLSTGLTGHTIVQFTASSTSGTAPLTVQFKTPEVDVLGKAITSWNWSFGDGATSTVQNPSHTYATVGAFTPSLLATNDQGVEVIGYGPQITTLPINLVENGGFETGDFTNWTVNGDFEFCYATTDPTYVHSGIYGAELGPSGSLGYLSQTLTTLPGQSYLISVWLNSPDGLAPNEFLVNWNGNTIFDQTDIPAIGWTNLQFTTTATGASTVLQFGFGDDLSYLGLDDISVLPISAIRTFSIQTTGAGFGVQNNQFGFNITGANGSVVVVEASTNLVNPLWIPVATNALMNGTFNFRDPVWTNHPSRFYRISAP